MKMKNSPMSERTPKQAVATTAATTTVIPFSLPASKVVI